VRAPSTPSCLNSRSNADSSIGSSVAPREITLPTASQSTEGGGDRFAAGGSGRTICAPPSAWSALATSVWSYRCSGARPISSPTRRGPRHHGRSRQPRNPMWARVLHRRDGQARQRRTPRQVSRPRWRVSQRAEGREAGNTTRRAVYRREIIRYGDQSRFALAIITSA